MPFLLPGRDGSAGAGNELSHFYTRTVTILHRIVTGYLLEVTVEHPAEVMAIGGGLTGHVRLCGYKVRMMWA